MKKSLKNICFLCFFLLFLTSCTQLNENEFIFFKRENKDVRNKKLIEDLEYFEKIMLQKYQKEYRHITDVEFKNKLNELRSNIDNISDSEFLVEVQRIMSCFKEGHLSFLKPSQAILPFNLQTFEDGTYIVGTEKEYTDYNFTRIVSINGIKIDDIRTKMKEIVSGDNKYNVDYWVDDYITDLDYLVGLNIISNVNKVDVLLEKDKKIININFKPKINRGVVTIKRNSFDFKKHKENVKKVLLKLIERASGEKKENLEKDLREVENIDFVSYDYIGKLFLKIENIPYKLNPIEFYNFETFPKSKAIVLHYNKCFNEEYKPFDKFSMDFFRYIKNNKNLLEINNIVIDLRYNRGGSELFFNPFVDELKKYENENKNLKIHILVGRNTFSAGVNVLYFLKKTFKNITIYGEPPAGGINSSGNITQDILPNSNLIFAYGQNFFDNTKDNDSLFTEKEIKENVLIPDEVLKPTIEDYIDNRDYVLEEVLNRSK